MAKATIMKLVIDVPEETLERVRKIVKEKDYDDPSEFLIVALENQIVLEESTKNEQSLQSFDDYFSDDDGSDTSEQSTISNLDNGELGSVPTCQPPSKERISTGPLWGQYNRIFPIKIVVRNLANSLKRANTKRIDLEKFQDKAAKNARDIGLRLEGVDDELNRGRGEKLSSGLPVGANANKSLSRFKEQFVGRVDKQGNLDGACPVLQFVDISPEKDSNIGLTEAGLEFAELHNPLLDDSIRAETSLSDAEKEFFLKHVSTNLSREFEAINTALQSIQDGDDRPDGLTEQIAQLNGDWSENQASTIRTGLVSRLHELGLLTRERVGQRGVAYKLTDHGQSLLENVKTETT